MLSDELIHQAIKGTSRTANQAESASAQLMLKVAHTSIRSMIGYVVARDHTDMPEANGYDNTLLCSNLAMEHLHLILSGVHRLALREWLVTANFSGKQVHTVVIPALLSLGYRHAKLRPYIVRLVGQRGIWLASQIKRTNWNWLLDLQGLTLVEVIQQEKRDYEAFEDAKIRKQLYRYPISRLKSDFAVWMKHHVVWSELFAEAFLFSLSEIPDRVGYRRPKIPGAFIPMLYFFPLSMKAEIRAHLILLQPYNNHRGRHLLKAAKVIWEFRESMMQTLRETPPITVDREGN